MKPLRPTFFASVMIIWLLVAVTMGLSIFVGPIMDTAAHPLPIVTPTMLGGRILIQVVAPVAYFRTGPGSRYGIVTKVNRLNKIELSGISQDRAWYMFKYNQKDTWISADKTITQLIQGDPKYLPVITVLAIPTPASSGD